jgi:predicted nucleic acid-binding protein
MPPNSKPIKDGSYKKKYWRINSKEGLSLEFFPIFEVNEETGEVEARWLEMKSTKDGKEHKMTFNWLDIYMFVYFTANEELRQQLASRYERKINYVPYDVTIQLSSEEKATGVAKRRVELPVDELTMAIARNEAWKIMLRGKIKDPKSFKYIPGGKR